MSEQATNLAFFWGEDAYGMERAVRRLAADLAGAGEPTLEIWRADAEVEVGTASGRAARLLERIEERLGTAPLFGGGTLVALRQPMPLLRDKASRTRLLGLVGDVPPGNALAVTHLGEGGNRQPKALDDLRDTIAGSGGLCREFPALTRERMERWIGERAGELGITLAPGAARLLAERIGAFVREGDVDRLHQSELANGELEKLALLRPGGIVTRDDITESVPEAIPGSTWAFLDAVAQRRAADAARIATRLLDDGTPLPVIMAQLHRRLRELVVVRDHLSAGTRPPDLVRALRMQPFRAQKLAEQAGTWSAVELDDAMEGLLDLELASKGISLDGAPRSMSDGRSALGLLAWLADSVTRDPSVGRQGGPSRVG